MVYTPEAVRPNFLLHKRASSARFVVGGVAGSRSPSL